MSVIQLVLREPYVDVLRKSKLTGWVKFRHKHEFKTIDMSAATLKARIPKSAVRVTEVLWSIKECSCGELIEELRQEATYPEESM